VGFSVQAVGTQGRASVRARLRQAYVRHSAVLASHPVREPEQLDTAYAPLHLYGVGRKV